MARIVLILAIAFAVWAYTVNSAKPETGFYLTESHGNCK